MTENHFRPCRDGTPVCCRRFCVETEKYGRLYFIVSDDEKDLVISSSNLLPDLTRVAVRLFNQVWQYRSLKSAIKELKECSVEPGDVPDLIVEFFRSYEPTTRIGNHE